MYNQTKKRRDFMLKTDNALALAIDFQERMMPVINDQEELTRRSAIFLRGCRILGVPVLVTQQYTRGLGETIPEVKEALGDFEPIEKITFSCYGNKEFRDKLEKTDKKDILVTGVEAHICVQQTVLDLLESGHTVYIIADCIGSRFENDRQISMRRMEQAGAILTTMESVLFEMMVSADHPGRKEISNLVK